ncbi:hypothetical protein OG875_06010 [Streptomyces sp. NBC_01498]|uniref:hypothetical protein n=1 Tax=Streptomyces sp. NBC_01498 TaxID=2975870 RepID=UPI002E7C44C0|nr:hypothetical protein [Streptomyces sp. NBC_01498]WTL24204.1 hypothetical protein OG875_06010 [Streptomyces sp. NBC_01498]
MKSSRSFVPLAGTALGALAAAVGLLTGPAQAAPAASGGSPSVTAARSADATETIIPATSRLARGESWSSPDGSTVLRQQDDGHVVLYRDGVAIWTAVGTHGVGTYFYVQADGNLTAYDAAFRPLWESRTGGSPGAYLTIQNAGNLVVRLNGRPLWWSNFHPGSGPVDPGDPGECQPRPNQLCP